MLKLLDKYILKRFVSTYIVSIALMLLIFIIIDLSEKLKDLMIQKVPAREVIFEYYLNFIPYYGNLFSPLFTFITIILFTSKLASKTEFVAMLTSGISFNRVLRPYFIGAIGITIISIVLNHYIIPLSNHTRINFEDKYINRGTNTADRHIRKQIEKNTILYFSDYNISNNSANNVSIEKVDGIYQTYILRADNMMWDSIQQFWTLNNIFERHIYYHNVKTEQGVKKVVKNTTHQTSNTQTINIDFYPKDMSRFLSKIEVMPSPQLIKYIAKEKEKGSSRIEYFEVELYIRTAFPIASLLLTVIGVCVSSRKIRGGTGVHIAIGVLIACIYILMLHVFKTLAVSGFADPLVSVWIPNIVFSIVTILFYKMAQK